MIDLHAHLLPGVDDGPATPADALALARETVAAGIFAVAVTPHVSDRYPNEPGAVRAAVRALRAALAAERIPLAIHPGAELTLERAAAMRDRALWDLHLGSGRHVLLECPLSPLAGDPEPLVEAVQRRGHRVVLAHPERSPLFQQDPSQLERLVAGGALTSVTAGAIAGRFGPAAQRLAFDLLEAGLVHNLASDMHDLRARPPGIRTTLEPVLDAVAGLEPLLGWLTYDVPRAILTGTPIPPGPAVHVRRRPAPRQAGWRRLARRASSST